MILLRQVRNKKCHKNTKAQNFTKCQCELNNFSGILSFGALVAKIRFFKVDLTFNY